MNSRQLGLLRFFVLAKPGEASLALFEKLINVGLIDIGQVF